MSGLRQRKKQETAERIALAAGMLFAQRGYESVSVSDVAAAADVSAQTVFNYFPTKEDLVFDRTARLDRALAEAIRHRREGTPAAAAIAPVIHGMLERTAGMTVAQQRGGLVQLAAGSAALRRGALERTRMHAATIADALAAGGDEPPSPEQAILGWAVAGLIQFVIEELGAAQVAGEDPGQTAARLRADGDRRLQLLARLG
jgi:AcrR family transcriptional regulator